MGDEYTLTANAIDTNVRHVWLVLSKNGVQLDDIVLNEGYPDADACIKLTASILFMAY
ncbi:MAG: hypothetical protein OI717_00630 (plasmid) [Candidatus Methanoperedens sp.]|nr:MAG: hypothetical protein OI717_00630 [Candidatus Methanoperedens sp.]